MFSSWVREYRLGWRRCGQSAIHRAARLLGSLAVAWSDVRMRATAAFYERIPLSVLGRNVFSSSEPITWTTKEPGGKRERTISASKTM